LKKLDNDFRIGRIDEDKFIGFGALDDIRVVVLKQGYGEDAIKFFEHSKD
jgi:hypothetical protein